jgi:hypothetical protein
MKLTKGLPYYAGSHVTLAIARHVVLSVRPPLCLSILPLPSPPPVPEVAPPPSLSSFYSRSRHR